MSSKHEPDFSNVPNVITEIPNICATTGMSKVLIFYSANPDDPVNYSYDFPTDTYTLKGGKNGVTTILDILSKPTEFEKCDPGYHELTTVSTTLNPTKSSAISPSNLMSADAVFHPKHYTRGGIECIDAIKASMTKDEFAGYCKGNVLKYLWRFEEKNGIEDLEKANVYLKWLTNTQKGENLEK